MVGMGRGAMGLGNAEGVEVGDGVRGGVMVGLAVAGTEVGVAVGGVGGTYPWGSLHPRGIRIAARKGRANRNFFIGPRKKRINISKEYHPFPDRQGPGIY